MTEYREILRLLQSANVRFIVIGGVAGIVHGSARFTQDLDVVYDRSPENLRRLVDVLAARHPSLRGAPPGLPFRWDLRTVQMGLNFTLAIDAGALDLLGEVAGGGTYEHLLPHSDKARLDDAEFDCVDLPTLIRLKRAAGRPKDFDAIAELELLLERRRSSGQT